MGFYSFRCSRILTVVLVSMIAFGLSAPGATEAPKPLQPKEQPPKTEYELKIQKLREEAQMWGEERLAKEVEKYLFNFEEEHPIEESVFELLGVKVHAPVIKILGGRTGRRPLNPKAEEGERIDDSPLHRVCHLLRNDPPLEAVRLLSRYLNDPIEEYRYKVAFVMGNFGKKEGIDFVRKAFADSGEHVRAFALTGLLCAAKERRLAEDCAKDLYADIYRLLEEDKSSNDALAVLLEIDRARTQERLFSPAQLNLKTKNLFGMLAAMAFHELPVPRDRLLRLIEELEASGRNEDGRRALGRTLVLLGRWKQPEDRALLKARMAHRDEHVCAGAKDGLLASHGVEDFHDKTYKKEEKLGWARLSVPQRHYLAVHGLDFDVVDSGLARYFEDDGGARWREALEGLEAMGLKKRAEIFRKALKKFGSEGPSKDDSARSDQLEKLTKEDNRVFEAIEKEYRACDEPLEPAYFQYAIKNAAAFR